MALTIFVWWVAREYNVIGNAKPFQETAEQKKTRKKMEVEELLSAAQSELQEFPYNKKPNHDLEFYHSAIASFSKYSSNVETMKLLL